MRTQNLISKTMQGLILIGLCSYASLALAEDPVLLKIKPIFQNYGSVLKKNSLESVGEIEALLKAGKKIDGWRWGLLVTSLVKEVEFDLVENEKIAALKVNAYLELIGTYQERFKDWERSVKCHEAQAYLYRAYMDENSKDEQLALDAAAAHDKNFPDESQPGFCAYQLSSLYGIISKGNRKRNLFSSDQLLKRGIELAKDTRKQFSKSDISGNLIDLYGKRMRLEKEKNKQQLLQEEWINYVAGLSENEKDQHSYEFAGIYFSRQQDDLGLASLNRHVQATLKPSSNPDIQKSIQRNACMFLLFDEEVMKFATKNPTVFAPIQKQLCNE